MENNYKEEIVRSRFGALGGSDGNMLMKVAELGSIPKSFHKRLAIVKGLIEQDDISSPQIRYGNFIEQSIFDFLASMNEGYQSNPMWVSKEYSKKNCKLICHPDFVLEDKDKHVLRVYECKATKYGIEQTKYNYQGQLLIEYTLACERARELGNDWGVQLFLCHYNTNGVDLNAEFDFDPGRLTIRKLQKQRHVFDINLAMNIVNDFLETFNEYYEGEVIDAEYLPSNVKSQFDEVARFLREIKEREQKVEMFKARLFNFMKDKDIKNISCDSFSITRVDPTTTTSFDTKKYLEDFMNEHPRKCKKVVTKYTKVSNKNGYCMIKVNKNKDIEDIFK